MPKSIALLVFVIVEIVLLPITVLGQLLFFIEFAVRMPGKNLNLTTYDPAFARWILDALGKREDKAARQLTPVMPGVSRLTLGLAFAPTLWLMRITNLTINMYDYPVHRSTGIIGALSHRTRFFDDALLGHLDSVEQVVILGAGWDTRAYTLARREGVRVFEVDDAGMQVQKRLALEAAKVDTTGVVFASADFNLESWLVALRRVDFDPDKPTFVLLEGVTYYLNPDAIEATLQTVATKLAKGSAVAFDYVGQHIIDGEGSPLYRLAVPATRFLGRHIAWVFGIRTDSPAQENLTAFLAENGLRLAGYEPVGKPDPKQRLVGGLALAANDLES